MVNFEGSDAPASDSAQERVPLIVESDMRIRNQAVQCLTNAWSSEIIEFDETVARVAENPRFLR